MIEKRFGTTHACRNYDLLESRRTHCSASRSSSASLRSLLPFFSHPVPLFMHLDHIALFVTATGRTETEWQKALKKKTRNKRSKNGERESKRREVQNNEKEPAKVEERKRSKSSAEADEEGWKRREEDRSSVQG